MFISVLRQSQSLRREVWQWGASGLVISGDSIFFPRERPGQCAFWRLWSRSRDPRIPQQTQYRHRDDDDSCRGKQL